MTAREIRAGADAAASTFFAELQAKVADLIKLEPLRLGEVRTVGGVDVSYSGRTAVGCAVVSRAGGMKALESSLYRATALYPYIPGLLFLREAPVMTAAVRSLGTPPDLLFVDGHGIAHPRRAGLASLVGLVLDHPTLGVAKSLLAGEVGRFAKGWAPILLDGQTVGYAVKVLGARPFYVSPGHRARARDVRRAIQLIGGGYPWVLKEAHRLSKEEARRHGHR